MADEGKKTEETKKAGGGLVALPKTTPAKTSHRTKKPPKKSQTKGFISCPLRNAARRG